MNASNFSFPVPHPYTPEDGGVAFSHSPPQPARIAIPTPQPFYQGSAASLCGPPTHSSSFPNFRAPYGMRRDYGSGADNYDAAQARYQTQYHPTQPIAGGAPTHSNWVPPRRTSSPTSFYDNTYHTSPQATAFTPPYQPHPARPSGSHDSWDTGAQARRQSVRRLGSEEIRPNRDGFGKFKVAVHELETCKTIFEQLDTKFINELMIMFPKETTEFSEVQQKAVELKLTSAAAYKTAKEVQKAQMDFARLVLTKLEALRDTGGGILLPDEDISKIGTKVEGLQTTISKYTDSLRIAVVDLSALIRKAKNQHEGRYMRKLWDWLVRFFDAIANALGIAQHGITAAIGGSAIVGAAVGVNRQSLIGVASAVCKEIKKHSSAQEDTGFQWILKFLENDVPQTIKKAQVFINDYTALQELLQTDIDCRKEDLTGSLTVEQATKSVEDWKRFIGPGALDS